MQSATVTVADGLEEAVDAADFVALMTLWDAPQPQVLAAIGWLAEVEGYKGASVWPRFECIRP